MKTYLATAAIAAALSAFSATQALAEDRPAASDSFWSRVTLEAPIYTHHFPHDSSFNDENWGLVVDVAVNDQFSVVGGDFKNSYDRNTAFAGLSWEPLSVKVSELRVRLGGMAAVDLNGGYRPFNSADPLLAALNVRLVAADPDVDALHRLGLLVTIIPAAEHNGSTAVNLALTFRLR